MIKLIKKILYWIWHPKPDPCDHDVYWYSLKKGERVGQCKGCDKRFEA